MPHRLEVAYIASNQAESNQIKVVFILKDRTSGPNSKTGL